jgi:hypothetical protein
MLPCALETKSVLNGKTKRNEKCLQRHHTGASLLQADLERAALSGANFAGVGSLASVSPGEWVTAEGRWVQDREFGLQFRAEMLSSTAPTTKEGIEKYLGSGMVKGIGPKRSATPLWLNVSDGFRLCALVTPSQPSKSRVRACI